MKDSRKNKVLNILVWIGLIILFCLTWGVGVALAGGSECSTIQNSDERAYCRAVATNSRGNCSAISDWNLRQRCNARLGAPVEPTCSSVPLGWQREACKDAARARR